MVLLLLLLSLSLRERGIDTHVMVPINRVVHVGISIVQEN